MPWGAARPPLQTVRSHAAVARGVLDYLMRDMTHPEGGLFAAEDADRWGLGCACGVPALCMASCTQMVKINSLGAGCWLASFG